MFAHVKKVYMKLVSNIKYLTAKLFSCYTGGHEMLLFDQFFPKKCMKMKEIRPRVGTRVPGAPFGSNAI